MGNLERTIVDIREEIALMALDRRFTVTEVALRYGVSRPTVRLWRDRYREQGRAGLEDRSHAPRTCPHRMSDELEELIVAERERYRWGSKKILRRLEDAHPLLALPGRSAIDAVLCAGEAWWKDHGAAVVGHRVRSGDVTRPASLAS